MAEARVRFPDGTVRVLSAAEARELVARGEAARVLTRDVPVERTDRDGRPDTPERT